MNYKKNTIILGDGLHVFHPLAGQGFNLILRDIKKLKELISTNLKLGLPIKNSNILKDLSKNRKPENFFIGLGIDTTRRFFKHSRYFNPIKETILNQFSKSEFLKKISWHPSRCITIYNPVRSFKKKLIKNFDSESLGLTFLGMGVLEPRKRFDLLLKSFSIVFVDRRLNCFSNV